MIDKVKTKYYVYAAAACLMLLGGLLAFGPLIHWQIHQTRLVVPHLMPTPAIGLICIALGLYVARFHRTASLIAAGVSATTALILGYHLAQRGEGDGIVLGIAILATILTLVAAMRLRGTINRSSARRAFTTLAIVMAIGLTYGIIGCMMLDQRAFHQPDIDIWQAFIMTARAIVLPDSAISTPTRTARLFVASLNGVGLVMALVLLGALFRPLRLDAFTSTRDRERLRSLLKRYSRSSEDYFKLWPLDKSYYFSPSGQAALTYKTSHRSVIILGDPSGEMREFDALLARFFRLVRERGWRIIVINASARGEKLYANHGLNCLPIGSDATVDLSHFMSTTRRDKHFRYITNKAHRLNVSVEEWSKPDVRQIRALHTISNAWLRRDGRREYTFFMGYFDSFYLQASRIFVLSDASGPIAYVSLLPSFRSDQASIDHFRSLDRIPSIGMHYLLSEVAKKLSSEEVVSLNLGFAPLSRLSELELDRPTKQLLELVRRFGERYYSFRGVEQFKNKFDPVWKPQSLLFSGTIASLGSVMRDIDAATRYREPARRWLSWISVTAGLISLVAIIYICSQ